MRRFLLPVLVSASLPAALVSQAPVALAPPDSLMTMLGRFTMLLMASFAGIALVLSALGLYGVLAYQVVEDLLKCDTALRAHKLLSRDFTNLVLTGRKSKPSRSTAGMPVVS